MNKPEKKPDENSNQIKKNQFIYPIKTYHGQFSPENLIVNANLQEFAQRSSYIVGLHTNGKLSSQEAYQQLEQLWLQLKQSNPSIKSDNLE